MFEATSHELLTQYSMNHPNIMLIDDDPTTHFYHKMMIELAGMDKSSVSEYLYAADALVFMKEQLVENSLENWPDFIFLDINMPKMNGWEFLNEIKKLDLGEKLPKIYMVSNSDDPLEHEKLKQYDIVIELKKKYLDKDFFIRIVKPEASDI